MRTPIHVALLALLVTMPLAAQVPDSLSALPWIGHRPAAGGPLTESLVLGVDPARPEGQDGLDTLARRRPRAVELSGAYAVRLKIHQIGSFLEFPVFAAEIIVGQKLARDRDAGIRSTGSLRNAHSALAAGLGVLFGVNTITGGWNLVEGWQDPKGRTRRVIHSVAMLAADAGFLLTAANTPHNDRFGTGGGTSVGTHRAWAISSSAIATAATLMMWLWKN